MKNQGKRNDITHTIPLSRDKSYFITLNHNDGSCTLEYSTGGSKWAQMHTPFPKECMMSILMLMCTTGHLTTVHLQFSKIQLNFMRLVLLHNHNKCKTSKPGQVRTLKTYPREASVTFCVYSTWQVEKSEVTGKLQDEDRWSVVFPR